MNRAWSFITNKLTIAVAVALMLGAIVVWLGYMLDSQLSSQSVAIQVIQLFLTTLATIIPTRVLAQRQEAEINRNRAKMALKRTVTLVNQMNQVAQHIETQRKFIANQTEDTGLVEEAIVANSFDAISDMHKLQYGLIDDISSDWQDVIPEELARIKKSQLDDGGNND